MKVFKWIYYPVIIVLTILLVTFGFVTAKTGSGSSQFSEDTREAVDTHISALADYGTRNENQSGNLSTSLDYIRQQLRREDIIKYRSTSYPDADGLNSGTVYATTEGTVHPSLVLQNANILPSTSEKIENGTYYVNRTVTNLIVSIPGSVTLNKLASAPSDETVPYGDAILYTAHVDSLSVAIQATGDAPAVTANAASVANMIETINAIAQRETPYKNDFVFVFTTGSEENALGAYAFKYQFTGFYNIVSRVKVALNFDVVGNTGAVLMSETSGGSGVLSAYAKLNGKTYSSSLYSAVANDQNGLTDFAVFDDDVIAALGFSTLKNANSGTAGETVDALSASVVNTIGNLMLSSSEYFGDLALNKAVGGSSSGFFNYLGGAVWYADYVAYIMAALIILVLGGAIALSVIKKSYNFAKIGLGAAVQAFTILATLAASYLCFLVYALLSTGFEAINIHALATAFTASVPLLVFAIILALSLSVIFYIVFKRVFAVKASDVVRGNVLITALIAIITCFAAPKISYIFFVIALLQSAVFLLSAIFKDKFKGLYGFDIERLFLYVIPVVLMLPVLVAELYVLSAVTAVVMLPLYLSAFVLFGGAIMPYADYLRRPFSRIAAALPGRTVRVERVVTERIEDEAKKGKFTEVTHPKIFKEKEPRTYSNAFGISVVAFISTIAIVLLTAFGAPFGSRVSSSFGFYDSVYKDALVYVYDSGAETLEVHDLDAYKYISRYVDGFEWDEEKSAYVKNDSSAALSLPTRLAVTRDAANDRLFTIVTSETGTSRITVTLKNFAVGSIDTVTFTSVSGAETEFTLSESEQDAFTFILPYGEFDSGFTFEIEGDCASVDVDVEQRAYYLPLTANHAVYSMLRAEYSTNPDIYNRLTMNVIMRAHESYTF